MQRKTLSQGISHPSDCEPPMEKGLGLLDEKCFEFEGKKDIFQIQSGKDKNRQKRENNKEKGLVDFHDSIITQQW